MQITLNETEIQNALKSYMGASVGIRNDAITKITFINGRGEDGVRANIEIVPTPQGAIQLTPQAVPATPVLGDSQVIKEAVKQATKAVTEAMPEVFGDVPVEEVEKKIRKTAKPLFSDKQQKPLFATAKGV